MGESEERERERSGKESEKKEIKRQGREGLERLGWMEGGKAWGKEREKRHHTLVV